MSAASGIDELDMYSGVSPLDGDTLELRGRCGEVHPGANRDWCALRAGWLRGQINLGWRKPYRSGRAGYLLGAGRHLPVDAVCVAAVRTHEATLEHTFDYAVWEGSLRCGKTAGGFAIRVYP